jgi:hypothetical protein
VTKIVRLVLLVVLGGCASQGEVVCTMEAKACPDGSYVGRDPTMNCQFRPCPR